MNVPRPFISSKHCWVPADPIHLQSSHSKTLSGDIICHNRLSPVHSSVLTTRPSYSTGSQNRYATGISIFQQINSKWMCVWWRKFVCHRLTEGKYWACRWGRTRLLSRTPTFRRYTGVVRGSSKPKAMKIASLTPALPIYTWIWSRKRDGCCCGSDGGWCMVWPVGASEDVGLNWKDVDVTHVHWNQQHCLPRRGQWLTEVSSCGFHLSCHAQSVTTRSFDMHRQVEYCIV